NGSTQSPWVPTCSSTTTPIESRRRSPDPRCRPSGPHSTATATPPNGSRPCSAVRCAAVHRDVAIIGAGYVGVPLAQVFADAGRSGRLFDVSPERVAQLNCGESYIEDVPSEKLKQLVDERGLRATTDYDELRD